MSSKWSWIPLVKQKSVNNEAWLWMLTDKDPCVRRSGILAASSSGSDNILSLLIQGVADPEKQVWLSARDAVLHHCPWLQLEPVPVRPVPKDLTDGRFTAAWRQIRLGLRKYVDGSVSNDSLRRLIDNRQLRSSCPAHMSGYSRNVTVNPDLTTFPYNAIGVAGPAITSFEDFCQVGRHHSPVLKGLQETPCYDICSRCVLWYRGLCQGVCLAEIFQRTQQCP